MKKIILLAALLCQYFGTFAQQVTDKPSIDSSVFYKWPKMASPMISPDGKHVLYIIKNKPLGANTLVVKSTTSSWAKEIVSKNFNAFTTLTNTHAAYVTDTATGIINLDGEASVYCGYTSFQVDDAINSKIIALHRATSNKLLILEGKKNSELSAIKDGIFVRKGRSLLLRKTDVGNREMLTLYDLFSKQETVLWSGYIKGGLITDKDKKQLAFVSIDPSGEKHQNTVVYINLQDGQSFSAKNEQYPGFYLNDIYSFNETGDYIMVSLTEQQENIGRKSSIHLTLWSYTDKVPQFEQVRSKGAQSYTASIPVRSRKLIRLQEKNDVIIGKGPAERKQFYLTAQTRGECFVQEMFWNLNCKRSYYLVDIATGSRRKLPKLERHVYNEYLFSPDEHFIVFFDYETSSYFSYNVSTDKLTNITAGIDGILTAEINSIKAKGYLTSSQRGFAGWLKDGKSILIYDNYDIWLVDLNGAASPKNLTNGYGRRHKLEFSMPNKRAGLFTYNNKDEIILPTFNLVTKDNGFYKIKLEWTKDPEQITMGAYVYYIADRVGSLGGIEPVKAANAHQYILERSSSAEFPNYFVTSDFKRFTAVSNEHPERQYQWPTTELHTYTTPDGEILQGVLYKPADFDAQKKYPVIFNYYQRVSNSLNDFIMPDPLCYGCNINYPQLVGNGYLVFRPDMHYKENEAGRYALQAITAAVKHLSQFSWIDTSRMGAQGCSWGGFETNYFISHSNLFKAACTAAGASDIMGFATIKYETLYSSGYYGQFRLSKLPWESSQPYIENSPIFRANAVETPVLFMHTSVDDAVPYNQAIQFFLTLRKLGKPAWLLEYGGEQANHGIRNPLQAKDFSLRMLQFFDHYLKGRPAPKWMLEGIPAKDAATETGLQLQHEAKKTNKKNEAFEARYYAYKNGRTDSAFLKSLVVSAEEMGKKELAHEIAQVFINSLSKEELFKVHNLGFAYWRTESSKDRCFPIFLHQAKKVNKVFEIKNVAEKKARSIIVKEEVKPLLNSNSASGSDWAAIEHRIKKYGQLGWEAYYGERMIYMLSQENWEEFGRYYVLYYKTAYNRSSFSINNISWKVFLYVNDPKVLDAAIRLMAYNNEHYDKGEPNAIDTYAALLYKQGRTKEAIQWQQKAVSLEAQAAAARNAQPQPSFAATLEKMKRGEKLWK